MGAEGEQRWCVVGDGDGHRYLCPADRADEVEEQFAALAAYWDRLDADGECPPDPSEGLQRLEGHRLTFTDPRIEP